MSGETVKTPWRRAAVTIRAASRDGPHCPACAVDHSTARIFAFFTSRPISCTKARQSLKVPIRTRFFPFRVFTVTV